mgnify:CR=1 FL=1
MSKFKPKTPKGPSPDEIAKREEAARERERERIRLDDERIKGEQEQKATAALAENESRRKRFAGKLTQEGGDPDERKRFLKGAY